MIPTTHSRQAAAKSMSLNPSLFCIGLGYSARYLAQRLLPKGWTVTGTYREDPPAGFPAGVRLVKYGDVSSKDLSEITRLLLSAPPGPDGDPVMADLGTAIREAESLQWIGYLSTTGVYGDAGGAWVDESSPLNPGNDRGRYRADAEAAWLAFGEKTGVPVQVFRLAGIYGPGRNPVDQVKRGTARRIDKPGHAFSRIHVEDIAAVLEASINTPNAGAIYNVCDDEPAPQADVIAHACELLGVDILPLIRFDDAAKDMSPMALSFWADNRRVSNKRLREELGVNLSYPSYREGLASLV